MSPPVSGHKGHIQRLKAQLAAKDAEIEALKASHRTAMDALHVQYGLEEIGLRDEITKLKEELAQEKASNTARLNKIYDLLKQKPPSFSAPPRSPNVS